MKEIAENTGPTNERQIVPASFGNVLEIPTLYTGNKNSETRGFYLADSLRAQVYSENQPSMGRITTRDGAGNIKSWASGSYVTEDGLMATDWHAVKDPNTTIQVVSNGRVHNARVVDKDVSKDLALLQVEPAVSGERFRAVDAGTSADIRPGTQLIGLGYPHKSDNLHLSPGVYTRDLTPNDLRPMLANGKVPDGEDANRRLLAANVNFQQGDSGGFVWAVNEKGEKKAIGVIALTDQGANGYITPMEDVTAMVNRTRRAFPAPSDSFYNRMISQTPDWLRTRITGIFGDPQPAYGPNNQRSNFSYTDGDTSYWQSKLRTFSLRGLFS